MKSNSGHEHADLFIASLFPRFLPAALLVLLLFLPGSLRAMDGVSITEMAHLSAADRLDRHRILAFFRGCSSLGLRREAAIFLERRIHLGEIAREEAAPLFEEILAERGLQEDPEVLLPICETAFRAGVRTPMILYAYGTALRFAGRLIEGSEALARIDPRSPLHPYAIYGIGQIAAERGDEKGALEAFRRALDAARNSHGGDFLARRAIRSQAALMLATGRLAESSALYRSLPHKGEDPYLRIGTSLSGTDNDSGTGLPVDAVAALSPKERILYYLVMEGFSRERGRHEKAVAYLDRASEESAALVSPGFHSPSESGERSHAVEILNRQVEIHRVLRQSLLAEATGEDPSSVRDGVVELMAQLLFLDHTILRTWGSMTPPSPIPEGMGISAGEIDEIVLRIAQAALDGRSVEQLVEEQAKKLELLQNLAHPIQRYRLLAGLEKGQAETRRIADRIRQRREAIGRAEEGGGTSVFRLLTDLGQYLDELEALRKTAEEIREITREHFNILRARKDDPSARSESISRLAREALGFDNDRFGKLLPAIRALEDRTGTLSRQRVRQEILDLRPAILLRLVGSLTMQAGHLAATRPPGWSQAYWAALSRAVSCLDNEPLPQRERVESAIRIGLALTGGGNRWETFPGRSAGEKEIRLSAALLPILAEGSDSGERQEESLYVLTLVRMFLKDRDALGSARRFLEKYPSSPFAGALFVRVGNASLLEGRDAEAISYYRKAADGTSREAVGIARFMLGWDRFRKGDTEGAIRELSVPLSDPSFSCVEPSSFEESVLSLAVRAWKNLPPERLASYPPVREGGCGGKLLLSSLGEAEESRGENARAAKVFDALSNLYTADRSAVRYETRAIGNVYRAGKDEETLSRAIRLKEKYKIGSPAESPSLPDREMARKELAEVLAALAERKFEEGMKSGNSLALALSAVAMEQLSDLSGEEFADKDAELLLKRSIALIRSGNREEGVALLLEILGEQRSDAIGERAALLYAETMVGAYERKEETAEDAEGSAWFLLEEYPSEKAAVLAYRSAAAFLHAGEYDRAVRISEAVEKERATPVPLAFRARLVQAEAFLFAADPGKARARADSILGDPSKEIEAAVRARARDVFLLACLKLAEASTERKDWKSAAGQWEELENRFSGTPEAPGYGFRAFQAHRLAGDPEGVVRTGFLFLRKYPEREERFEVAGVLGPHLEERKEHRKAAEVYASVAESAPGNVKSQQFLFLAARLSDEHGDPESARKRYAAYRSKYSNPRWMTSYAALAAGLLEWRAGRAKGAVREMEEGLRRMEGGVEPEAPEDLGELAWKVRIAIGEYWSEQFRALKLVVPLEKSLAAKDRFFRRALGEFERTEEGASLELAVTASQMSGDLLAEFGKSILSSQIPKGMRGEERKQYEEGLKIRARTFLERALDRYTAALDRLEAEKGPSDLAVSIRQRMEEAQKILAGLPAGGGDG